MLTFLCYSVKSDDNHAYFSYIGILDFNWFFLSLHKSLSVSYVISLPKLVEIRLQLFKYPVTVYVDLSVYGCLYTENIDQSYQYVRFVIEVQRASFPGNNVPLYRKQRWNRGYFIFVYLHLLCFQLGFALVLLLPSIFLSFCEHKIFRLTFVLPLPFFTRSSDLTMFVFIFNVCRPASMLGKNVLICWYACSWGWLLCR